MPDKRIAVQQQRTAAERQGAFLHQAPERTWQVDADDVVIANCIVHFFA